MTALEVIKKSALILNIDEIISGEDVMALSFDTEEEVLTENFTLNRMFEILKIMLHDISADYVQIEKEDVLSSTDKKISLSLLSNCIRVVSVKENYISVKHKVVDSEIEFDHDGVFSIKYLSGARVDSLFDEMDMFNGKVGIDVLVYGLSALYCLAVGLFEEFNVYNSIYVDKLSALKTLKIINMPSRSWV